MKVIYDPFKSHEVYLTKWELIKLFFGYTINEQEGMNINPMSKWSKYE